MTVYEWVPCSSGRSLTVAVLIGSAGSTYPVGRGFVPAALFREILNGLFAQLIGVSPGQFRKNESSPVLDGRS